MSRVVNIHQAKTHLSRLLEEVVNGEPFVIAKAGKPLARVAAVDAPVPLAVRRTGFLSGQIAVPDDFDAMGRDDIERSFFGNQDFPQ